MPLVWASSAHAQTGVSDDRVSLPDGPGSIEGLGDNAEGGGSRGGMSYRVPLTVPNGYSGLTPSVDLSYSSLAGSGILGIGWSMEMPSIERLTLRGLPTYDADDEFSVMGSEQLVRVSGGDSAVYRARMEGGFVRYTFHGAGAEGYWEAEYPNGQRAYFGADAGGNLVSDARLSGERGTFRYLLVERVDLYGHRIRYRYSRVDGRPYCERISYGPPHNDGERYEIAFDYEPRPDVLSDAKPGFEERTTQRLTDVEVLVRGLVIRRYGLNYEDTEVAGGLSRLASVERFGRDGTRHPIRFSFGYERALSSDACGDATECEPHVVDMGTVPGGANFVTGSTTLADLNGDSLPDLVDTSRPGAHRIFLSEMMEGDATRFAAERPSGTGNQSAFDVRRQNVQVLDINGDGFTDLVNLRTSTALCNLGTGDWVTDGSCEVSGATGIIPVATSSDADPTRFRFVDMDSDRRIDLVHTPNGSSTLFYRNTEDGFVLQSGADAIGRVFDVDRLFLSDVNADGLLDALVLGDTGVASYKLNLGQGRWEDAFQRMDGPTVGSGDLTRLVFEDLNSDGRDDMVLVLTNEVRFALNRNGERFDANAIEGPSGPVFGVLSRADLPDLPSRGTDTTVLFADMNGNGTRDIVWVERTGEVRYVELFATPPNLISRIENSLGSVQEITYTTSVAERRRSELAGLPAWTMPMPMSMNLVARMDIWEELTGDENGAGLHDITEFAYENGFYDGIEKQFRGFVQVTATTLPDATGDTQERGRIVEQYDVGQGDPYRAGKLLMVENFSGEAGEERALRRRDTTYDDCAVAEVPDRGLRFPIRHVCQTESRTTLMEGRPEDEWRTQRVVQTYSGYGQVIRSEDSGFLELDGDETITESEYIEPGDATDGRWILDRMSVMRRSGTDRALQTETSHFYDGDAFVGLERGLLTTGLLTRVTERISSEGDGVIQTARRRFDSHGNEIELISPRGSEADADEHRTRFIYDADGFLLRAQEIAMRSPEGDAYVLRRERSYDDSFDLPVEATAWMVQQGEESLTPRNPTRITYNEFMELTARFQPGDPVDAPSIEYVREYGAPVTAFRTLRRSERGGDLDLETVLCQDGRGRSVQTRRRTVGDAYQVSGFSEYNSRGAVFAPSGPLRPRAARVIAALPRTCS
ncbi:MAG: toxin TcdB middle/N-terminal domain-containing protein [Myxococcota bacterium]